MIEDELSKIWKSSPQEEQVKFDRSRFMLDVQSSLDKLQREVKIMYIREGLGAFIAIPMFSYYAYLLPNIVSQIGCALVVVFCLWLLYFMKTRNDLVPDKFSMSYLEYLKKTKVYLEDQKRLRENVFFWYVLPPVVAIWAMIGGTYFDNPENLDLLLTTIPISLVVGVGIHFMNVRSSKKVIVPRLEKVNKLIKTLEE